MPLSPCSDPAAGHEHHLERALSSFNLLPTAADAFSPPPRLGDLLVRKGLITEEQLTQALAESRATGTLVGQVLLHHRWVFEDELARTLAQQWSLPYVDLLSVGVDWGAVRLVPPEVGLRVAAIPVRFVGGGVQVAFADPSDDTAVGAVTEHVGTPSLAVGELSHIRMLWSRAAKRL
jgi:hypothetical protein